MLARFFLRSLKHMCPFKGEAQRLGIPEWIFHEHVGSPSFATHRLEIGQEVEALLVGHLAETVVRVLPPREVRNQLQATLNSHPSIHLTGSIYL